jgi:hypothetical protein
MACVEGGLHWHIEASGSEVIAAARNRKTLCQVLRSSLRSFLNNRWEEAAGVEEKVQSAGQ